MTDIQELRRITIEKSTEFSKLGGTKQLKIVLEKIKQREELIAAANSAEQVTGFGSGAEQYDNSEEREIQIKRKYIE